MVIYASLSFNEMKKTSETLPAYFFSLVRRIWGERANNKDVAAAFSRGVFFAFTGNNPPSASEVRYVLFLRNISKIKPFVVNIHTNFSVTDAHQNIINRYRDQEVVTAGILRNDRFSEISSEWVTRYTHRKPEEYYHFGILLNRMMLKTLHIEG